MRISDAIKRNSGKMLRVASQNISPASRMLQGLFSKTPFDFS